MPNIEEILLPGAHSDIGGGYPRWMLEGSINLHVKKGGLDAFALSLMWESARRAGVPLRLPSVRDRTGIDPRGMSNRQLAPYIHDSRVAVSGVLDYPLGRRERTIHYIDGTTLDLEDEQLNRLWRSQRSLPERLKEDADGQMASEAQ